MEGVASGERSDPIEFVRTHVLVTQTGFADRGNRLCPGRDDASEKSSHNDSPDQTDQRSEHPRQIVSVGRIQQQPSRRGVSIGRTDTRPFPINHVTTTTHANQTDRAVDDVGMYATLRSTTGAD